MNIYECLNQDKPFRHPDMIGAYKVMPCRSVVHRDNLEDFDPCNWDFWYKPLWTSPMAWESWKNMARDDWELVE